MLYLIGNHWWFSELVGISWAFCVFFCSLHVLGFCATFPSDLLCFTGLSVVWNWRCCPTFCVARHARRAGILWWLVSSMRFICGTSPFLCWSMSGLGEGCCTLWQRGRSTLPNSQKVPKFSAHLSTWGYSADLCSFLAHDYILFFLEMHILSDFVSVFVMKISAPYCSGTTDYLFAICYALFENATLVDPC